MRLNLAGKSLLLFGVSVVLLILYTLLESVFAGMSVTMERIITFLLLVLPASVGAGFGVMSLVRKEGHGLWVLVIILLNVLFALFHIMLILFAG